MLVNSIEVLSLFLFFCGYFKFVYGEILLSFFDLAAPVRISAANRGARPNTKLLSICVVSLQVVRAYTFISWMDRVTSRLSEQ